MIVNYHFGLSTIQLIDDLHTFEDEITTLYLKTLDGYVTELLEELSIV